MADKHEVNDIARALSIRSIINYTGLSKSDSIIVHKAIEKLAKGEGNSDCGDIINPYSLPGFRNIIIGSANRPDYIAFYMRLFGHKVMCLTDISADSSILGYSSNSAAGVMLYNQKACKLQFNVRA